MYSNKKGQKVDKLWKSKLSMHINAKIEVKKNVNSAFTKHINKEKSIKWKD